MSHNRSQTYNERSGGGRNSPSPTKRKRFLSLPGLNVAKASKPQWSEQEKKKFQAFLGEMLRLGCLKGFKYFAMTLRGREELICRVLNEPMSPEVLQYYTSPKSAKMKSGSSSFTFDKPENMPRNSESLLLSRNSQLQRDGNYGDLMDVGLPPASPSEKDTDVQDNKSTLFLIAAYARYNYPYVWIRSNHNRIVQLTGKSEAEIEQQKDSPLKLKSTENWKKKGTKLWEIIAEVIQMCMFPSPLNPFAVDHRYFDSLPLAERIIATGAMANLLQEILANGNHSYNAKVFDDLHEITRRHFRDLYTMTLHKMEEERLRAYEEQKKHNKSAQSKPMNHPFTQYNQYVIYPAEYNVSYQAY